MTSVLGSSARSEVGADPNPKHFLPLFRMWDLGGSSPTHGSQPSGFTDPADTK